MTTKLTQNDQRNVVIVLMLKKLKKLEKIAKKCCYNFKFSQNKAVKNSKEMLNKKFVFFYVYYIE